jgi:hypothetical protein
VLGDHDDDQGSRTRQPARGDEPTSSPEGTEVELLLLDPGVCCSTRQTGQRVHAALAQSQVDIAAGRLIDAADVLKRLRAT